MRGENPVIIPATLTVKLTFGAAVTMAPVLASILTSPDVNPILCSTFVLIRTLTVVLLKLGCTSASTPSKYTDVMLVPLPSRFVPLKVTVVPDCPSLGVTLVT